MKLGLGTVVCSAALALTASYAMAFADCGTDTGPFDDSGHATGSNTNVCYSSPGIAGRSARFNMDTLIISSNGYACDNADCVEGTCKAYVTFHTAGQPVIGPYEDPIGSGCWKATAQYTTGNITLGCTSCDPL